HAAFALVLRAEWNDRDRRARRLSRGAQRQATGWLDARGEGGVAERPVAQRDRRDAGLSARLRRRGRLTALKAEHWAKRLSTQRSGRFQNSFSGSSCKADICSRRIRIWSPQ